MAKGNSRQRIPSFFFLAIVVVFLIFLLALGSDGSPAAAAASSRVEDDEGVMEEESSLIRVRKHASDQRIAELQALVALAKVPKLVYGHGQVDPESIGRRKRIGGTTEKETREYSRKMIDTLKRKGNGHRWRQ